MSWDGYIDNLIGHSKDSSGNLHVDKACIIGLDGGAPWTTASNANNLCLQGTEGSNISNIIKTRDYTSFQVKQSFDLSLSNFLSYFFNLKKLRRVEVL